MNRPLLLCDVPVDDVTMEEAVTAIEALVADGRASDRWHQVATVNVDFVVNAIADDEVLGILQRTSLSIPDGMPLLWAARALGVSLRERVAGADLIPALAARSAETGLSLYFFGSAPGIAEQAAERLHAQHPGARITGESGPMMRSIDEMDRSVLDDIRRADPDIVCVALGNPKQERWIARYGPELGVPVLIGVGGTFDFLVGGRRRAPGWMQRSGLEWVYRALQEPRRLGPRYAKDFVVLGPRVVRQWWRERRTPPTDIPSRPVRREGGRIVIAADAMSIAERPS